MWIAIDIIPPASLIVAGLLFLHRGGNTIAAAMIATGILQTAAFNRAAVLAWLLP